MVAQALTLGAGFLAVTLLWFAGTGLVAWSANRGRATFARSLVWAGFAGIWGLGAAVVAAQSSGPLAAYAGFAGALAIWGWHELSFLTGAVTGPNRAPCPPGARGLARFRAAAAAVIWHELALAGTLALLSSLVWSSPNPVAAHAFALLFGLRLSTKLAIFAGAPDFSDDLMPAQIAHLKSYFGRRRGHPLPYLAAGASVALALWLGARYLDATPGSGEAVAAALLFALAALGSLEHLFLVAPVRDAALWRWALPPRAVMTMTPGETTNGL